jgi:hypothetical protein
MVATFAFDFVLYLCMEIIYILSTLGYADHGTKRTVVVKKLLTTRWVRLVFVCLLFVASITTAVCISYESLRGVTLYIPIVSHSMGVDLFLTDVLQVVCLLHPCGIHAVFNWYTRRHSIVPQIMNLRSYRSRSRLDRSLDWVADESACQALELFYGSSDGPTTNATYILGLLEPRQRTTLRIIAQALPCGDLRSFLAGLSSWMIHSKVMQSLKHDGFSWLDCNLLYVSNLI